VRTPERDQPAFNCLLPVLNACRRSQALDAMALTVASVFFMRWCNSSRMSFCSLSADSRSLARPIRQGSAIFEG
jgi:hypothetical protein